MFETHQVEQVDGKVVDTRDLFPPLTGQEWYRTVGFKEVGFVHGTLTGSFRQSATWLNRLRHQSIGTPCRTLSHNSVQEGTQVLAHLEQHAEQVLETHGFAMEQPPVAQQDHYQHQELVVQSSAQVQAVVACCAPEVDYIAELANNPVPYEVPAQSVQISIDPVGVKHQKASHDSVPKEQKRDLVYQTIAHLQHAERTYLFNGRGIALGARFSAAQ